MRENVPLIAPNPVPLPVRAATRKLGPPVSKRATIPKPRWQAYVCLPAMLWLMLWAALNSGPWVFREWPVSFRDWLHFARTTFPLIAFVVAPLAGRVRRLGAGLPGPLRLWALYGVLGVLAAAMSPQPLDALYFGVTYLSAFVVLAAYLRGGDPLERSVELNYLTWFVTTGILAILCVMARHVLSDAAEGATSAAYNVADRVGKGGDVGGMAMVLSSGFARFAAVPAVVAYVMLWRDRRAWRRLIWAGLLSGACMVVYLMQSRGATASLAFALLVTTYVLGKRARVIGFVVLLAGVLAIAIELVPQRTTQSVFMHLTRGETIDRLGRMGGRTTSWEMAWDYVDQSPIIGSGFQADRYLGLGHVHNTYLYVLLTAGIVGLVPFVGGLAWTWLAVLRALKRNLPDRLACEPVFAQTVGILAFFTMRGIPEVCGGLFMVDLMVMLPAMAYLARFARPARRPRDAKVILKVLPVKPAERAPR